MGREQVRDRAQLAGHLRAMAALLRDVEVLTAHADVGWLANPDMKPAVANLAKAYEGARGVRADAAPGQPVGLLRHTVDAPGTRAHAGPAHP